MSREHSPQRDDELGTDAFLTQVRSRLDEVLADSERFSGAVIEGLAPSHLSNTADLVTLIRRLLDAGGKLIRPRLVLLGYLAGLDAIDETHEACATCHGERGLHPEVVDAAAAFELLHVFGLLQDDVMDSSPRRRGLPAAHRLVADAAVAVAIAPRDARDLEEDAVENSGAPAHDAPGISAAAARSPSPEPSAAAARFGDAVAVLAGDLAFALAGRLTRRLPESVADVWDTTVVELVQGQRLDLLMSTEGRFDEASTERVADAKSGAYTVSRPLEVGAKLAGAPRPPAWLQGYGDVLGRAFALADDVIGVWGDPAETGKPVGEDLLDRKPSTVVGIAHSVMPSDISGTLSPERGELSPEDVTALAARMQEAGVRDEAERRIEACRAEALARIEGVTCPALRIELHRIADELATRRA